MAQKKVKDSCQATEKASSGWYQSLRPKGVEIAKDQLLYDNGSGYTISYVNSEPELHKLFKLRYKMYCVKMRYFDPAGYPDGIEIDAFDATAAHFSGKLDEEAVGTSRLIFPIHGLHLMETYGEAFRLPDWIPRETSVELSRLIAPSFQDKEGQAVRQSLCFLETCCWWALEHDLTHIVAINDVRFNDYIMGIGWPLVSLGNNDMSHHGAVSSMISLELATFKCWMLERD